MRSPPDAPDARCTPTRDAPDDDGWMPCRDANERTASCNDPLDEPPAARSAPPRREPAHPPHRVRPAPPPLDDDDGWMPCRDANERTASCNDPLDEPQERWA